jgi:hypothetical protein
MMIDFKKGKKFFIISFLLIIVVGSSFLLYSIVPLKTIEIEKNQFNTGGFHTN